MTEPAASPGLHRYVDAVFALIIASTVSGTVISLVGGDARILPIALIAALFLGTIFGLPAYVLAREHGWDRAWTAALTGMLIAAMPTSCAVITDYAAGGAASGWLPEAAGLGLSGLCAGLTFWVMMKWQRAWPIYSAWPRTGLNGLVAIAVLSLTYFLPSPPVDRTCHNPLRDGRTSIGASAQFDLHVGMDQWRTVAEEMNSFGAFGHWSNQSDVRPDKDFPWLQISLCKEPGTEIRADRGFDDTISFSAIQPQGGLSWQAPFGELYRRLNARWPGKISFSDDNGNATPVPRWALGKELLNAAKRPNPSVPQGTSTVSSATGSISG